MLGDNVQIIQDQGPPDIAALLEQIRPQMAQCQQGSLLNIPSATGSAACARRIALYQLEAVIESLFLPEAFPLNLPSAYHAAIQAEHFQDPEAFLRACREISLIIQSYANSGAQLNRLMASVIQRANANWQEPTAIGFPFTAAES
jgi:hypothetical protein